MAGYGLADAMYDLNKGMEQGQDRKFQVEQREKDAAFQDESRAQQRKWWGLQEENDAYQKQRRQVTDQRADEQWAHTQELWKDEDAKRAYDNSLRAAGEALRTFEMSGGTNWGGIIKWYNDTNNYDNGLDIKDVKRAPDGSFTATFNNGQTKVYKDVNDVREQMAMAMHPDAWIKLRADRKYGGSHVPAQIQLMEYYKQELTGGDSQAAYRLTQAAKENPAQLAGKLFMEAKKNDKVNELSDEQIMEGVRSFIKQMRDDDLFNPMAPKRDAATEAGARGLPGAQGGGSSAAGGAVEAPAAAIDHLRKNPQLKDKFKAKYGYLPQGI